MPFPSTSPYIPISIGSVVVVSGFSSLVVGTVVVVSEVVVGNVVVVVSVVVNSVVVVVAIQL